MSLLHLSQLSPCCGMHFSHLLASMLIPQCLPSAQLAATAFGIQLYRGGLAGLPLLTHCSSCWGMHSSHFLASAHIPLGSISYILLVAASP